MSAILPTRRLIPKWRPARCTLATQEAISNTSSSLASRGRPTKLAHLPKEPAQEETPTNLDEFEKIVTLWNEHQEPGVLGDILSFSIHKSLHQRIVDIGRDAIRLGAPITPAQQFVISRLAQNDGGQGDYFFVTSNDLNNNQSTHPFSRPIRQLRALLRSDHSNSLALLDFALLQAAIGCNAAAEKSLRTALGVQPNSRLVLRSLARFYVHIGDFEKAHVAVRKHALTPHDPWLMASEIALADLAGKPSTFLAKARRTLVEAGKAPAPSLTELAGSLAMAELGAGNLKKAREFQRLALMHPTDNVAAQAVDRERAFGIALNTPEVAHAIAASPEAQLLKSWLHSIPENVERHALDWHREEPFSSRPVQVLAALYAYQGQCEKSIRLTLEGLRSDPEDRGLLINLAYAQAHAGDITNAQQTIAKIRRLKGNEAEPFMCATEGLIEYRHGQFGTGDRLYAQAIELFDKSLISYTNVSTYCLVNQAIAAIEYQHPDVEKIVFHMTKAMKMKPNIDSLMLLKVTKFGQIANAAGPDEQNRQRLTSQWIFDPKNNTLTKRVGLTAPGASHIIING